jgi:hypothetical protein
MDEPFPATDPIEYSAPHTDEEDGDRKKKKKKKKERKEQEYTRAVETLFRSAYHTHVSLTAMADGKASIMLTINGLLATVVLASITPRIDKAEWLLLPVVITLLTCVGSLVFAVLAVRPRINRTRITLDSVRRDSANLLFFGNYVDLGEAAFRQGIEELLHDPDRMYEVMTRDLYGMGTVLARKYRLLRHCYDIFAAGLILSVLAFAAVYVMMLR